MKKLFLITVLLLIPLSLMAQYNQDGRRIFPETVGSTQLTNGSVANADLATTAVDGGVCLEATQIVGWFPVSFDSTGDKLATGTNGWALDGTYPPVATYWGAWQVFAFDADIGGSTGDDRCYLNFVMPFDYDEGGLVFYLYWFVTEKAAGATDSVEWDLSVRNMGDADSLLWSADSSLTVVFDVTADEDSNLYICEIDPELSINGDDLTYDYGDLVIVTILVDENGPRANGPADYAYLLGVLVTAEKRDD